MSMFDAFLGMKDSQSLDREVKVRGVNLEYEKPGEPAPLKSLIDRVMADDNEDGIPSQRIDGVGTTMQRRFECIVDRAKRVEQSFVFQTFITICIVVVSVTMGIGTNETMNCARLKSRVGYDNLDDQDAKVRAKAGMCEAETQALWIIIVDMAAQVRYSPTL